MIGVGVFLPLKKFSNRSRYLNNCLYTKINILGRDIGQFVSDLGWQSYDYSFVADTMFMMRVHADENSQNPRLVGQSTQSLTVGIQAMPSLKVLTSNIPRPSFSGGG